MITLFVTCDNHAHKKSRFLKQTTHIRKDLLKVAASVNKELFTVQVIFIT